VFPISGFEDGSAAFALRQELASDGFQELAKEKDIVSDVKPDGYGFHGSYQLVGQGKVTNEKCGKFFHYVGCLNHELHRKLLKGDLNYNPLEKKIYVRRVYHSCDKPSCPVCYRFFWATGEAKRIEKRLEQASLRFGMVEHCMASVPVKDYGLSYEVLREKARVAIRKRGIIGGVLIFHGFRYDRDNTFKWYWSPHFHILGYFASAYSRCRGCREQICSKCDGFEGLTRRLYETDGWIVKVMEERKTVGGTAWYQLHHSSVKVGVVRMHVATWFGVCSYRKLKVTKEKKEKRVCPICKHELEDLRYFGSKVMACPFYIPKLNRASFEDLEEAGRVVWVVETRKREYGGGSYGE